MIIYKIPVKALFNYHTGKWCKKLNQWEQKEMETLVIGETYDNYIERLLEHTIPYWDENGKYDAAMSTAIGFHKSRFIKWMPTQTSLFPK